VSDLTTGAHEIIACVKELRAENAALKAECDAMRAIIAGRTTPPTDTEIEAHDRRDAAGGRWRVMADGGRYIGMTQTVGQAKTMRDSTTGRRIERWWPVNVAGELCAWPEATP
jgi:hypothetical protein